MWTYHGREFPAPTFELGMAPAGSMYIDRQRPRPVPERAVRRRQGAARAVVKPETLEQMWTPQFAKHRTRRPGLRPRLHGRRSWTASGASATAAHLRLRHASWPRCPTTSSASSSSRRATWPTAYDAASPTSPSSRCWRRKQGKPLPAIEETHAARRRRRRRKLAGRYKSGKKELDLLERDGRLWVLPGSGGYRAGAARAWATI